MLRFGVIHDECYDYAYEAAAFNLEQVRTSIKDRITDSMIEAEVLLEAYTDVVMEAGPVSTVAKAPAKIASGTNKVVKGTVNTAAKAGKKMKAIVDNIIRFFKNLYQRFVDNMQTWFQNSGKWLASRKDQFAKFNYDELSTDMVPYWDSNLDASFTVTTNAIMDSARKIFGNSNTVDQYLKLENFQKANLGKYYDRDGDLKEGIKNFYRVGAAAGKDRVTLKGADLRNRTVNVFIPTILNYDGYVKKAQSQLNSINSKLSAIGNDLDRRGVVVESALFGLPFEETEFAHYDRFESVLENVKPVDNNNNQNNTNKNQNNIKDSADSNRTQVTMNKDNRNGDQKAQDSDTQSFSGSLENKNDYQARILNNIITSEQLLVTSYLTVMEERYTTYMNALKAIWKVSNTVGDRNTPDEQTEVKK